MTDVVTELGTSHVTDFIGSDTTKSAKMKNVSTALDAETIAEVDEAILHLNRKLPPFMQCNRSNFVHGAILFALKDLDAMLTMTQD